MYERGKLPKGGQHEQASMPIEREAESVDALAPTACIGSGGAAVVVVRVASTQAVLESRMQGKGPQPVGIPSAH